MREKYNELRKGNTSKNHLNDDTPMCERHEVNSIQSEGYQNQLLHDSSSRQSLHNPNDSEELLTDLNNDVRNDLEDFKRRIRSMRTVHWKLYDSDDRALEEEKVVVGDGVVVTSSSLEMLTNNCLGGIMVSLIFLEGLDEEALVKFMVE
ncbi:hypothetical protein Tco_0780240 [Tanacetum coccineum]